MDPVNNQVNQVPPQSPVQQVPQAPENSNPKSSKNFMMIGIISVVILAIVLSAGIYIYMSLPTAKTATTYEAEVSNSPTPIASEEKVVVVNDDSDLESLLVEVANADGGFESDLEALEKDSNF